MIFTMADVSKRYNDNVVLEHVSMKIEGKKVYGLTGDNGGGKSTIAKIVCGMVTPDEGSLSIDQKVCTNWSIKEAMREGVFLVAHETTILPYLSVEENILLGINFVKRNPLLGTFWHRMLYKKKYKELLKRYGITLDTSVSSIRLSRSMQNIMELIRIQICNPKLVVIDEVDTNMNVESQRILDKIIDDLVDAGAAVIYISHHLESIIKRSDVIGILVENQVIDMMDANEVNADGIMDTLLRISKEKPPKILLRPQDMIFEMKHVHNAIIEDFSIEVREGEIIGILGLDKEGDASFTNILFQSKGTKYFRGNEVKITTPKEAADSGLILLDANVIQNYMFMDSSIRENMLPYSILKRHLSEELLNKMCRRYLKKLAIEADPEDKIEELSTGQQKKVLIAKSILSEGEIYVFDRLTDNIDVISKIDIYNIINELKRNGKGVVLISNDYNEIFGISDLVYRVKEGKIIQKTNNDKQNGKETLSIVR